MFWNDIVDIVDRERFVGREQELFTFYRHIARMPPRYLIYCITGQGGVGKTTLLNRCREDAKDMGFLLADCNEQQRDVPAMLGRFADQLADQGFPLKRFSERYEMYRQHMYEIERDPDAPQGLAATLGRIFVRSAYIGSDLVPGLRKGLECVPQQRVETEVSEWAAYLTRKVTNKDEVALIQNPTTTLTPLFIKDLNEIAEQRRVLLCFENFEETREYTQQWLFHLKEYKPSCNIRIAIAGRTPRGAVRDTLWKVTLTIPLDVFTVEEANQFLDAYDITDEKRRMEIVKFSGRLPILMSWLATPEAVEPDPTVSASDIVGRFLRWISNPELRRAALLAAIPRVFNLDTMELLLTGDDQNIDAQAAFDWLRTMAFVKPHSDGWQYHPVVRRMMLHYQRRVSKPAYCQLHMKLAKFYEQQRSKLNLQDADQWASDQWRKDTLDYIYHYLIADPSKHWAAIMSLFAVAVHERTSFATDVIELLSLNEVRDELAGEQDTTVCSFREQLQSIGEGSLTEGFEMFNRLCSIEGLSAQGKAHALAYRGECFRLEGQWEEALADFNEAIQSDGLDAWAIASRGEVCQALSRYEEALADFTRAIELNPSLAWAIADRGRNYIQLHRYHEALADFTHLIQHDPEDVGAILDRSQTYRVMGRYEEALADSNRAIEFNLNLGWAFAERGETYRLMGRYEEAWADLNRAIEADPENAFALASRGRTYRLMRRYEEALADFDRAIKLEAGLEWVIAERGETCRLMGRYAEAWADFDRAIELDCEYGFAITSRGQIYRLMGRYEEALADFDRAIKLEAGLEWAIAERGETYRLMGRYEEALADFDRAIEADPENAFALASRGRTYRLMGRYKEALLDFDWAIELEAGLEWAIAERGETYRLMGRYEEALADLNRAIELDCEHGFAITSRGETYRLMGRYEEALADFDRAIELDCEHGFAIASRGETYRLMGRYEEALADFDRAIELEPENASMIASRGETYGLMGRYEEALADFDRAIELDCEYGFAIASRAQICRLMGHYEEALADLNRAIELDPELEWAIAERGETYRLMGRYEEALADFDHAIKLDLQNAYVHSSLGNIYWDLGHYDEAIAAYQQAIGLDPHYAYAHNNLASIYFLRGEFDKARHHFEKRISLSPDSALNALVHLGIIAQCQGNTESDEFFLRALSLWNTAWETQLQSPAGLLEDKVIALLCTGEREAALETLREALAQYRDGDKIEFGPYELLAGAAHPPDGIEEILAMLRQANEEITIG